MTETQYQSDPDDAGAGIDQSDEGGELAPDRPTNDAEDLASAVHEEEAREQSGI